MVTIPTHYPLPVTRALQTFASAVEPERNRVHALAIHGSLARGDYHEGDSTVDLAVVLEDGSLRSMDSVRAPLYELANTVQLRPLLVGVGELARLTDVFPILVSSIKRHHDLLYGAGDPFLALTVKRRDLRVQVEHELRSHLLRLRRYYLLIGDDVPQLGRAIVTATDALVVELGAMLELKDRSPGVSNCQAVFAAAAETFKLDHRVLAELCEFKPSEDMTVQSPAVVADLFSRLVSLVENAVAAVDRLDIQVWGTTGDTVN